MYESLKEGGPRAAFFLPRTINKFTMADYETATPDTTPSSSGDRATPQTTPDVTTEPCGNPTPVATPSVTTQPCG